MPAVSPDTRRTLTVRRAVPEDLRAMARVHVATWKTTYRGMVPDDRLDQLTVESDLAGGFGRWLKDPPTGVAQFVALVGSEGIIGYAMGCPTREPEPGFTGELGAIYVLRDHQGKGVGTALVAEVARHLLGTGHANMIVWVLERNPYRRFYEHLGGVEGRRRTEHPSRIAGVPLAEVSYLWPDLRRLAAALSDGP